MKHLLLTTIAAVVLVGCGESKQSVSPAETQAAEPVAEATQPKPPTAEAPDISLFDAATKGNIEAIKQHLAAGTDVDAKSVQGLTPLHVAAIEGHKEILKLLIAKGADVNAKDKRGRTPLVYARGETADLLRKHGGKRSAELKAEGK